MQKLREVPDPSFVNLISCCLEWDPLKRISPEEALNHEWVLKGLPPGVLEQHKQQYTVTNQSPKIQSKMHKAQSTKSSVQEQLDAVKMTPRRQAVNSMSYNFDSSQKKGAIREQASEVDAE